MRESTWHETILVPTPEAPDQPHAQGTGAAPVPKRNHNRKPGSTCRGREPLTTEQQQQITTLAAAGYSQTRISKTIGKGRNMVKRHLETPEAIAQVREERTELVELYRQKARDCVAAIDDEKIAKASALQLATSSGILLDKSLLLSGKPTQNVAVIVQVLDMLAAKRDEEDERQLQEAKAARALLSLPANSAVS